MALPWRLTESEMEIAWDQIIFDNTLLGQVPEEGVSRLVTQQISERRDHYVRYGLAFMLEHGFMKTDRGRLCYRMNLEQIRNAILETAYLGVMDAYLRCKRPSFMGGIRAGMQRLTGRSLARALSQEVEQFAMVQKTEYGFDLLDVMGKKVLKQIGVTADLWILPEGMKMYLNLVRKENFQSPNAGAMGAIAPVGSRAPSKPDDVAVDVAYDCRVVETKSFELPNMSEPLNPMERPATIGEYYVMQNHLRGSLKPEDYRSAWRDVFLYNEDKDGFTRITLDAALRNCGRFDPEGDLATVNISASGDGRDGTTPPDMFYRRVNDGEKADKWQLTDRMGDIHSQYLRDGGLGDWADSVVAKIVRADPQMARSLRDGLDLCRRIDNTDTTDGAQNTWSLWLWLVHVLPRVSSQWNEEHGLPYPPTKEEMVSWANFRGDPTGVGMHSIDTTAAVDGVTFRTLNGQTKPFWAVLCEGLVQDIAPMMEGGCGAINAMPVGYASWPGLCVLANPRYRNTFGETQAVAARFVSAFETLYSELNAHTHDSIFLNGQEKPPWLKSRDGRSTLFSNLLYVSHAPIWMRVAAVTKEVDAELQKVTAARNTLTLAEAALKANTADVTLIAAVASAQTNVDNAEAAATAMAKNASAEYVVRLPKVIAAINSGKYTKEWATGVDKIVVDVSDATRKVFDYKVPWTKLDLEIGKLVTVNKLEWDGSAMSLVGDSKSYHADIDALGGLILNEIFKVKVDDLLKPENQTFARIIESFKAFFRQSSVVAASYDKGSGGRYMANLLYVLSNAIMAIPQPDDTAASTETKLYRIAAFINMAVNAKNLRAFALLMHAACTVIETNRFHTGHLMTWTSVPDSSLRNELEEEVRALSGNVSFDNIPDYPDSMSFVGGTTDATTTITSYPLPKDMMRAGNHDTTSSEMLLPTHLTGGAALRALTQSEWPQDNSTWISLFKVAVDPLIDDHHDHFEHGRKFANMVPPLLYNKSGTFSHKAAVAPKSTARVGAKRRFGANNERMPQRNKRGLYSFEEETYEEDHALDVEPWGDEVMSVSPKLSDVMRERWHALVGTEVDVLRRAVKLAFLGQPVNANTFSRIIASDDVFPFGFLLMRPYMTYSMASAILTVGGSRTGETLVGHADFQLADNVVQKMHIGNFTMYLKSIVYQPHHVWIADNVMACGYIGGNNCMFRSVNGVTDPPSAPEHPSLYACMVPYDCDQEGHNPDWEQELPNPLDITGHYSDGNPALAALKNSVKKAHYASSLFYRNAFGWNNQDQNMSDDSMGTSNRYNTLVFAGHYAMYNPQTQRYDLVHENTGHRGNRIYAGCGRVWKGLAKLLEPVNHISAFGGAPVRSMVTNAV